MRVGWKRMKNTARAARWPPAFFYNALTVGLGEAVACYVLGIPLLGVMQKHLKLN